MKRWIAIVILSIIVVTPISIYGQQKETNYLRFSLGACRTHLCDEHASPLIFSSTGIAPSIHFVHRNSVTLQFIEASFYHNKLNTSVDNFNTQYYGGRFRYSIVHALKFTSVNQNMHFYWGGSLNSFFNKLDYDYKIKNSRGRAVTSWYWSHSIDISARFEYSFAPKRILSVQVFFPIISNVSRPKYSSSGDYNYTTNNWDIKTTGETAFFLENMSLNAHLTYQMPLSAKLNMHFSYEFSCSYYKKPNDLKMYMNTFRLGLNYFI